jgi:glycosyltransferase involved in cell wall biosynthesis
MSYAVVIPAYNAHATIVAAIHSVLAQTARADDIVVVDDGSTDGTSAAIEAARLPVRLLRQDNAGPGSATTKGILAVSAPLIATLDADDLWLPEKIARQLAHLDAHPLTAAVFTQWCTFRGDPARCEGAAQPGWSRSTMVIRREAALSVGAIIDPLGGRGDMIDWIARARDAGFTLDMLDDVLTLRRIRRGSLSYGRDPARDRGYLEVARRAMQRRAARTP